MSSVEDVVKEKDANKLSDSAKEWFRTLIQPTQYVGEVFSISYNHALVQIHDFHRQKVGGIPSLSFLIATRIITSEDTVDYTKEDSSVILLRVMDSAQLPGDIEAQRIRVQSAQRVSGEIGQHWDSSETMDAQTNNLLSFAGINCRVIGTFFLENDTQGNLSLKFGGDISNYYPNKGLKVFKPNGKALEVIVNYSDPSNIQSHFERYGNTERVELGFVRYASTNRQYQQVDDVPVYIYPADLLSQKSALFGMTRTGKSNTTKIIAKSVFELRTTEKKEDKSLRIGQIIFDPNGEYANENVQDNNSALKNVWQLIPNGVKENEVVTYGITKHPNDPDRILMILNFFEAENLQIGKEIIDSILSEDTTTYIKNFLQVSLEAPDANDRGALTRHNRRVLAYKSILQRAGFPVPQNQRPNTTNLFNQQLRDALQNSEGDNAAEYQSAAQIFGNANPTWGQLANAFEALDKFIRDRDSGYQAFETAYVNRSNGSGDRWADEDLKKIIGLFQYPNGTRKIGKAAEQHSPDTTSDYAEDIYNHLVQGKLVVIDQSSGEPELNKSSATRIMTKIFKENQRKFIQGVTDIPEILVYVEEAHSILPTGSDLDLTDVWVRTAKEGSKYRIGMV